MDAHCGDHHTCNSCENVWSFQSEETKNSIRETGIYKPYYNYKQQIKQRQMSHPDVMARDSSERQNKDYTVLT